MTEQMNVPKLRFSEFEGEWNRNIFNDISVITRLAGYEYSTYWEEDPKQEIIALRGYNIGSNKLLLRDLGYISDKLSKQLSRSRLAKGDIVYPCVGTIGNSTVIDEDDKYHIQQNIAKITCNEKTSPYYVSQFLSSFWGMREVYKFNATSSQPNVLVGSLRNFKISLPKLPEQQKIASFLSKVDEKIGLLSEKKDKLTEYKRGVMQQLFNGKWHEQDGQLTFVPPTLRFKADDGSEFPDWEEKKLGKVIVKYSETSKTNNQHTVLTSSNRGLIKQSDYFGTNRITEKDNAGFNVIPEGYLTYRSRSDTRTFTFNVNRTGEKGITSTYYPVFSTKGCSNGFLERYLNHFKYYIGKFSVGTSQTVLSLNELMRISLPLPCNEEQVQIMNFLSTIDQKIDLANSELEKAKEWKKGLLQQMFV